MEKLSVRLRTLFKKFRATKFRTMEIEDNEMSIRVVKKPGTPIVNCNQKVIRSASTTKSSTGNTDGQLMIRKPSLPSVNADCVLESQAVTPDTVRATRVGRFYLMDGKKLSKAVLVEGSMIKDGDIIGFIESMSEKYEVRADMSGLVADTLVEDGEAVEYGQALARFDKSLPAQTKE